MTGQPPAMGRTMEARNVGWDAAGRWLWAVVIPNEPRSLGGYTPLARFQSKADAEAYIALLTAQESADIPEQT